MPKLPLYICKECEANFTIYSTYYSHIRKHKEPKINCAHCDKKFYVTSEYYKHLGKMHINMIDAAQLLQHLGICYNSNNLCNI